MALTDEEVFGEVVPGFVTDPDGRLVIAQGLGVTDVQTYGAKGDGTTDDTLAIQAAIDAAKEAGGGTIYFPPGTYRVEGGDDPHSGSGLTWALNISGDNILLKGAGPASIIKTTTANMRIIFIRGSWLGGETDDIQTNRFSDFVPYDMDDATIGSSEITLTTLADADNFAVWDWVYIRQGQLTAIPGNNEPDAEINRVTDVTGDTLTLAYPLAKDYADDATNPFGVSNVNGYVIQNVGIEDIAFDHQAGSESAVTVFDGVVGFTFKPAASVCSGQLIALRETKDTYFNVSVHFNGSHEFHWPITLATGCTDSMTERCLASSEQGVVQFHVHEGVARWKAMNLILLNPSGETANANSSISIDTSYDGTLVAPTVINGGHLSGGVVRVAGDTGYGSIFNPTILGDMGSANPILLAAQNWSVRDPHITPGKTVKLNYPAGGNRAPQTPIVQEELSAFVDYTDSDVILGIIPPDSYIRNVRVQVFVAFNAGSTNNLNVGIDGAATQFISGLAVGTTGVKTTTPSSLGWKSTVQEIHAAPSLSGTAASAGRALVTVEYSRSLSQ